MVSCEHLSWRAKKFLFYGAAVNLLASAILEAIIASRGLQRA
jgi:hypothetical protein